mmetsp:Transcript_26313/g.86364  ORF Transcript_26313/g.86364 Transcript_26313/m.86364 type:complete len:205 (-) Transcript_26313:2552-3166(-)
MYDAYKRHVVGEQQMQWYHRLFGGAISGAVAQCSVYPLETIRTRLSVSPPGTYAGISDCARQIMAKEGAVTFYRGIGPSLSGILPYAGVDMAVFETSKLKVMELQGNEPLSVVQTLSLGVFASTMAQFVSYPLYLVRTRMQAEGLGGGQKRGFTTLVGNIIAVEGPLGFYKGITPNMLKLAPAAAVSWLVVEKTKIALGISASS